MKRFTFFLLMVFGVFLLKAQPTPTTYGVGAGTIGSSGTYIGYNAGASNNLGGDNTFVGYGAGKDNEDGSSNCYIGVMTGANNISGRDNTYFGNYAGWRNNGSGNTLLGRNAGMNTTQASLNTFVGLNSGLGNLTGSNNVYVGAQAGNSNTEGSGNVFIGRQAGMNEMGSNKLYIQNNVFRGPLIYGDFAAYELAFNATVRIGEVIDQPAGYKLFVKDGILTEKLKIANVNSEEWADFVFEADYDLCAIEEVEDFVKTNKHLPNIPSADEVVKHGVDVVEMDAALLRQIEELWLHMMEVNDRVKDLEAENAALKTQLKNYKK